MKNEYKIKGIRAITSSVIEACYHLQMNCDVLLIRPFSNNTCLEDSNDLTKDWFFIFDGHDPDHFTHNHIFGFQEGSFKEFSLRDNSLTHTNSPHLNDTLSSSLALYIMQELAYNPNHSQQHLHPMIITLMSYLAKKHLDYLNFKECTESGLTPFKINQIHQFIAENIDQKITTNDIAKISGLSLYHFIRMFKRTTGETPHHFINRLKMERAKELLVKEETSIIQIGFSTGFDNPSHFTQVFKSFFGTTPLRFRKSILSIA